MLTVSSCRLIMRGHALLFDTCGFVAVSMPATVCGRVRMTPLGQLVLRKQQDGNDVLCDSCWASFLPGSVCISTHVELTCKNLPASLRPRRSWLPGAPVHRVGEEHAQPLPAPAVCSLLPHVAGCRAAPPGGAGPIQHLFGLGATVGKTPIIFPLLRDFWMFLAPFVSHRKLSASK